MCLADPEESRIQAELVLVVEEQIWWLLLLSEVGLKAQQVRVGQVQIARARVALDLSCDFFLCLSPLAAVAK